MNFNKDLKATKRVDNGYFHRVHRETPTQFWINGARNIDLGLGLQAGAVGITTNPSHPPRAIKADSEIWYPAIDKILSLNPALSDDEVADFVTQRIQGMSAKMLYPLYKISNGKYGYVAIQGNPNTNDDLEDIVERGIVYSKLGENIVVKCVSTAVGIKALEELTVKGINTIATEGFSVAQAIKAAEAYERGLKRTNKKPKCFIVHIAGIFDEYLAEVAEREDIDISSKYIEQAGVLVTRSIYRIFQGRKFHCMLLGGGARAPRHFTELVGGDLAITISLNTVEDLLLKDPPIVSKIEVDDIKVLSGLESKFVDFRRAYYSDGLTVDEFRSFGPCVKFQNSCSKGYDETLAEIRARRKTL